MGQFRYRHEAEFAAGFLEDAGIPYRLQVDDAGGVEFGLGGTRPAVLWVLGMDADRARELIGAGDDPAPDRALAEAASRRHPVARDSERLTLRQRGLAGGLAAIVIGVGLALPVGTPSIRVILFAIIASSLSAIAALGRAPGPIRALLRILSGEAP